MVRCSSGCQGRLRKNLIRPLVNTRHISAICETLRCLFMLSLLLRWVCLAFSKAENLAPLKDPKKVLPWLLRTEMGSTAHSWHGSIRKQQHKVAQNRLWHWPQRGVQVSGHLDRPLPLQAAMETKTNTDKRATAYDTTPTQLPQEGSVLTASWPCYLFTQISLQRQLCVLTPCVSSPPGTSGVLQVKQRLWSSPAQGENTQPLLLQLSLTMVILCKHKFGCTRHSQKHGNINMQVGAGQCWAVLRVSHLISSTEMFQLI